MADRTDGANLDADCLCIPQSALTFNGFREWIKSDEFPDKLRVTFVSQRIYLDMSKEELETHAQVKAEICRVLMNLVKLLALGQFYLDGVLVTNVAAKVSNNPDATFISWAALESHRARFVPRKRKRDTSIEIEGSPDWVLEVVSDSSVKKDMELLREAYHQAGIREYWLVDARGSNIFFQIFHWRRTGYARASRDGDWQRSRVFGRDFHLTRRAGRLACSSTPCGCGQSRRRLMRIQVGDDKTDVIVGNSFLERDEDRLEPVGADLPGCRGNAPI
jgi:Uma2 family endonuclease